MPVPVRGNGYGEHTGSAVSARALIRVNRANGMSAN